MALVNLNILKNFFIIGEIQLSMQCVIQKYKWFAELNDLFKIRIDMAIH